MISFALLPFSEELQAFSNNEVPTPILKNFNELTAQSSDTTLQYAETQLWPATEEVKI
jgi:hypothetical protein